MCVNGFIYGAKRFTNVLRQIPISQACPLYPAAHAQWYSLLSYLGTQVAPLTQGSLEQPLCFKNKKRLAELIPWHCILTFLGYFIIRIQLNWEEKLCWLVQTTAINPMLLSHIFKQKVIDHSRKYNNIPWCSLFVTSQFCISIVFSFSWGHFNSQEKLKTMPM